VTVAAALLDIEKEASPPGMTPGWSDLLFRKDRFTTQHTSYAPHAVDWRFLPEELLLLKDIVRSKLATFSNSIAENPSLAPIWARTLGLRPLLSVISARRLFVHVPRTGGTSVSSILYGRNLPHYTALFWDNAYGSLIRGFPSFSILREPTERLMSTFRFVASGGTEIMASDRVLKKRLTSFESFESFIDFVGDEISQPAPLPPELRRQSSFVIDLEGRLMVDILFSVDRTTGVHRDVLALLNVASIPRLNATDGSYGDVTQAARRKIERIYWSDFDLYDRVVTEQGRLDARGQQASR